MRIPPFQMERWQSLHENEVEINLSDWLFVASRVANDNGQSDVKWKPGANR